MNKVFTTENIFFKESINKKIKLIFIKSKKFSSAFQVKR